MIYTCLCILIWFNMYVYIYTHSVYDILVYIHTCHASYTQQIFHAWNFLLWPGVSLQNPERNGLENWQTPKLQIRPMPRILFLPILQQQNGTNFDFQWTCLGPEGHMPKIETWQTAMKSKKAASHAVFVAIVLWGFGFGRCTRQKAFSIAGSRPVFSLGLSLSAQWKY